MQFHIALKTVCFFLYVLLILSGGVINQTSTDALAADWPSWRGPNQNGVALETGLISEWLVDGENLIWKADFIGRSTPIVLNGRVYAIGRVGKGIAEQERVACFDAETGKKLWEHRFNVFHSTIPFNRLGWTSLVGDPETGNIYAHTVGGIFCGFDRDGKILWTRSLTEEFGRFSGYGGRLVTPIVAGNLVIVSFLNTNWGAHVPMRHRYFAFDKRTGEVVWVATPGGGPKNTTYSVPVVTEINGQRLLIDGNADGHVYAMKVNTGEKVWSYQLTQGAIHTSVVVDGTRVYAAHGGENTDTTVMGRVVCIDGTGTGDITKTHEIWRQDGLEVGYASPAIADGRLYVVGNAANLYALDAENGEVRWKYSLGTVGKGSPVVADGKIYVTEVNGRFHILKPGENDCQSLDMMQITRDSKRYAEIYGSPAIAYRRVYFTTEEGLYCLGDKNAEFTASPTVGEWMDRLGGRTERFFEEGSDKNAAPAYIQIVPAEVLTQPGETVQFSVRAFDDKGRFLREVNADKWSLNGLSGTAEPDGKFTPDKDLGGQAGSVSANVGSASASARVRVVPELPWSEEFESIEEGKMPSYGAGAGTRFKVQTIDGNKVLIKPPAARGLDRWNVYIGSPNMSGYTIQADLLGTKKGRRRPDMGLIANRYILDMQGNHQRLQVRWWSAEERYMSKTIDFQWESDVWYTVKLRVDVLHDKGIVKGKVWRTGEAEPEAWTITVEDPLPNREGSPGLYGYSPVNIYYDNLKVW